MKINFIYGLFLAAFTYIVLSSNGSGTLANANGATTGAPSEQTCGSCHSGGGNTFTPILTARLLDGGVPIVNYTGGRTYTLEISISDTTSFAGLAVGAQATILRTNGNFIAGTMTNPSTNASIRQFNARQYLEQNNDNVSIMSNPSLGRGAVYTATWTAPPVGTGSILIYASAVSGNGNGLITGDNTANASVLIPEIAPTTITYPRDSFCLIGSNPSPVITGVLGGVFDALPNSPTNGLRFINTTSGQIDIANSTPGRYIVSYAFNDSINIVYDTVVIVQQDQARFSYPARICQNADSSVSTPVIAGTTGGKFSCLDQDLVFRSDSTGQIDLSQTPVGSYSIVYTSPNTCADTQSMDIEVLYTPTVTITYPAQTFCGGGVQTPPATVFTFDNEARGGYYTTRDSLICYVDRLSGVINLNFTRPGTYDIVYNTTATCPSTATYRLTIERPSLGEISYEPAPRRAEYCEDGPNQGVTIAGAQNGRFFVMPDNDNNNAVINTNTGELFVQASDTGLHTIAYLPRSACTDTTFAEVQIIPRARVQFTYPSIGYCVGQGNAVPNYEDPNPRAFYYSNTTGVGTNINQSNGTLNISQLPSSNSGVNYTIIRRDTTLCGATDTVRVVVYSANSSNTANFAYLRDTVCINELSVMPIITGVSGGLFSINNDPTVINPSTGEIAADSLVPGSRYTVTYVAPAECPATRSFSFTASDTPTVAMSYPYEIFCIDSNNYVPTIVSNMGAISGRFSARGLDTFARNPLKFWDNISGRLDLTFANYLQNLQLHGGEYIGLYEIRFESFGTCPVVVYDTIQLQRCAPLSAYETERKQQFIIYPNPTTGQLFIQNPNLSATVQLQIYNGLGQLLERKELQLEQNTSVDLSQRAPGWYIIELITADGRKQSERIFKH